MPVNAAALNAAVANFIAADTDATTAATAIETAQTNHAKLMEARASAHSAVVAELGS